MDYLFFILAGCFAGIMSGLVGIGGGIVVVPALSVIFVNQMHVPPELVMHLAAGCSLCIMIFTSSVSVRARYKNESRCWVYFRRTAIYLVLGIVLGAMIGDFLSTNILKRIFGFFMLAVAFEMKLGYLITTKRIKATPLLDKVIMTIVGILSGLLGIGGATLLIPYLSRCRMPLRKVTSIAALSSLTAGIVGTLSVMVTGLNDTYHLPWSIGYVYLPAVLLAVIPSMIFAKIGSTLAYKLPVSYLRNFFIVFLLIVSLRMIL